MSIVFNEEDYKVVEQLIKFMQARGAIKAEEMYAVGMLYQKILLILQDFNKKKEEQNNKLKEEQNNKLKEDNKEC